ncbi:hypothetical protein [Cryptosporangium aurantiacum]|uniref:Uncharacterized protein n=1 Tax=Cryptosporangium aurantiacum TaxID=134849 RepID=A0A1M7J904_9ACTN|nr:hypothetical protein [Cryptosporangium aurantiacum]SHM49486.1 hypothetical protein SAMN05443668_101723 [Cryptosporangium aurantiacum]
MPLVPTDDTTGVTPAFWTPSITRAGEDGEIPEPAAAEPPQAESQGDTPDPVGEPASDGLTPPDDAPAETPDPPPVDTRSDSDAANSTDDTQLLHRVADAELPVFLDTTGRRRRRLRAALWLVSLAGLTYATILVVSMLGGHGAQSHASPELRPGGKQSPPATGAPVATARAELSRSAAATVDTGPAARATGSAPAATPRSTRSAPAASTRPSAAPSNPPAPTPSAAAPSPSPSGNALDGLLDTLFPWAS